MWRNKAFRSYSFLSPKINNPNTSVADCLKTLIDFFLKSVYSTMVWKNSQTYGVHMVFLEKALNLCISTQADPPQPKVFSKVLSSPLMQREITYSPRKSFLENLFPFTIL